MTDWQPINSGPKDGTRVLLFYPQRKNAVQIGEYSITEHREHDRVIYSSQGWRCGIDFYSPVASAPVPTHWAHLPASPAAA